MRGDVVYFYAFDVANEIVAGRVVTVLGERPAPQELRPKYAAPKDVAFRRPLAVVPSANVALAGRPVRAQVHIFEVGVVSVVLRVAFEQGELAELLPYHLPTLDDGRPLDRVAQDFCTRACRDLDGALVRPSEPGEPEAYTVFAVTDFEAEDTAAWLATHRSDVAGLLCGLPAGRLSDVQVAESLRHQWSLERADLVVVDWDAALVVDLDGVPEDVLFVLEIANLQLEEFRSMDRALDLALDGAYADLQRQPQSLFGRASPALRKLRWLRVDLTRLADEVTHITKFVGDWHLARVYLAARERLYLDRWRGSVDGRLNELDGLYNTVRGELFDRRLLWLEVLMAVFFAIDVVAILLGRR